MYKVIGNRKAMRHGVRAVMVELQSPTPETLSEIDQVLQPQNATQRDTVLVQLAARLEEVLAQSDKIDSDDDCHFVSRIDLFGIFQSVLAHLFSYDPELQGLGDRDPVW